MTTKHTHTPGPWRVDGTQSDAVVVDHGDGYTTLIAECAGNEANARLIAAAPDQHAALLAIVKLLDGSQPKDIPGAIVVAQAAIAKATQT